MISRLQIKTAVIRVLSRLDGDPMGEPQLADAVTSYFHGQLITAGDFGGAVADLKATGYLLDTTNQFTRQANWSLTPKGAAEAATLR